MSSRTCCIAVEGVAWSAGDIYLIMEQIKPVEKRMQGMLLDLTLLEHGETTITIKYY